MQVIEHQSLRYYTSPMWQHLKHGIFTRQGGHSAEPFASLNLGGTVGDDVKTVYENHQLMYQALDVNADRSCTTWQVHGVDVVVAQGPVKGRRWVAKADGIVTNKLDTPLVMRYADCTPLMFHDPKENVIGVAHAGWRGTVQGMGASMVQTMQQVYGSRPQDIQVVIGPSISQDCYQVGEEVVEAVIDYFGEAGHSLIQRNLEDGTAYFDLWRANEMDLKRCGVEEIEITGICTYQNTDEFFSHRAENGRTGRFGLVMSL